jgi:hypothetical protein
MGELSKACSEKGLRADGSGLSLACRESVNSLVTESYWLLNKLPMGLLRSLEDGERSLHS